MDDHRPVAKAVDFLSSNHVLLITYEDPRFMYDGDLVDLAGQSSDRPPGTPGRLRGPMPRTLDISYDVSTETDKPLDVATTLESVLSAHEVGASGGRFRIEQSGAYFHVFPVEVRDESGLWVEQRSVLETLITILPQELDGGAMLQQFVDTLAEALDTTVIVGIVPIGTFISHSGTLEAQNEPARDVLMRILQTVDTRLTWQLLYNPTLQRYALNVRRVTELRPEDFARSIEEAVPTRPEPARASPLLPPQ